MTILGFPRFNLRISLLTVIAACAFACANDAVSSKKPGEGAAASPATAGSTAEIGRTTGFDGQRAFAHVKALVEIGPRPAGSPSGGKAGQYIASELKSYGLKTWFDEFRPRTPHGVIKMRNVMAELPGESSEIIVIAGHYDTKTFKEFAFVGANDGGSSAGALLEIARAMAADHAGGKVKHRYSYQFAFLDGEEAFCAEWSQCLQGMDNTYGSRFMVEKLKAEKQLDRIKALILLDMIGDKDLGIPREENSSSWLVDAIWGTARELGYARQFPNRSHLITDDHINFLKAGVSAVDLIDFDYGDDQNSYWHTKDDTLDKISSQSLKIVGDVVILSLPRIEAQIR